MTSNSETFDAPAPAGNDSESPAVDLSAFDSEYEAAEAPDFSEVPDGKYQVRIQEAHLGESSKGDPMLKWDLVVISGQFAGRHIFKNAVITAASLPFVKGDLKTLGVTLPKFSELRNHLPGLLERIGDYFFGRRPATFNQAVCTKVDNDPVYSPDHMRELRQFTSVLTLVFRTVR